MKEKYNLDLGIEVLGLSNRTYNALIKANKTTLYSLLGMCWWDLIKIRGIGKLAIQELRKKLPEFGLALNGCYICFEKKEEIVTDDTKLYNVIDFKGCNETIGKEWYLIAYTGLSVCDLETFGPNDIINDYNKMHKKARVCYEGVPELFINDILNSGFSIDEKTGNFVRPVHKEVVTLEDEIVSLEKNNKNLLNENKELEDRIYRKQMLIKEYNQLFKEHQKLLDLERELDERLDDFLSYSKEINEELANVRKRK